MSSMRNAVQRRNHKERAQPEERQKWGLLEKRKVHSSPKPKPPNKAKHSILTMASYRTTNSAQPTTAKRNKNSNSSPPKRATATQTNSPSKCFPPASTSAASK